MGRALELLTGFVTAPSTTATALTMASGNSLTIRDARDGSTIALITAWVDKQGAGVLRIRSPKLGEAVQGLRLADVISETKPLLPLWVNQELHGQDVLSVDLTGSATAGDIETACLLVYYSDLSGAEGNLISPEELAPRIKNVFTVENTLALGTGGGYSGEETIKTEFDLMKSNTEYALLGYGVSAECAAIRWRGSDTSNYGVGGPGDELGGDYTRDWFIRLSRESGYPCIPVFKSGNAGAILIDGAQDENGTDVTVTSIFAELG
jgi:hypothetical protein